MGVVKYHRSKETGYRGELSGIVRVVSALDLGVMKDMARNSRNLTGHIAQHDMLVNIQEQIHTFEAYAKRVNPECLSNIQKIRRFVDLIVKDLGSHERLEESDYHKNKTTTDALARGLDLFR